MISNSNIIRKNEKKNQSQYRMTTIFQPNILMKLLTFEDYFFYHNKKSKNSLQTLKGGTFKQLCRIFYLCFWKRKQNLEVLFFYLPLTSTLIDNGCQNEIWRIANEKEISWTILFHVYCCRSFRRHCLLF